MKQVLVKPKNRLAAALFRAILRDHYGFRGYFRGGQIEADHPIRFEQDVILRRAQWQNSYSQHQLLADSLLSLSEGKVVLDSLLGEISRLASADCYTPLFDVELCFVNLIVSGGGWGGYTTRADRRDLSDPAQVSDEELDSIDRQWQGMASYLLTVVRQCPFYVKAVDFCDAVFSRAVGRSCRELGMLAERPDPPADQPSPPSAIQAVQGMLLRSDLGQESARLVDEAKVLGGPVLEALENFGVKILLAQKGEAFSDLSVRGEFYVGPNETTWDGRSYRQSRCFYDARRRVLALGSEVLGQLPRSPLRQELALAIDDWLRECRRLNPGLSTELWEAFANRRHQPVTLAGQLAPETYFPLAVEAYFDGPSQARMAELDPAMHRFLGDLVAGREDILDGLG